MKNRHLRVPVVGCLMLCITVLSGCVDNDYDLSDINTDVEFTVDHLTLPVNIDHITLSSVITINDDSRIKIVDGEYALTEEGSFSSSPITIAAFSAPAPSVSPVNETFNISSPQRSRAAATFSIGGYYSAFDYVAKNVNEHVAAITSAGVDLTLSMNIAVNCSAIRDYRFTTLQLQFPKDLTATPSIGSYDPSTGLLTISNATPTNGGLTVTLNVSRLSVGNSEARFDGGRHEFTFAGNVGIKEADVEVTQASGVATTGTLHIDFNFSNVAVNTISGAIDYSIDGMSINPVSLDNLPDFLAQSSTDIIIGNPQIFMSLTNPLSEYALKAQAGLSITPVRDGKDGRAATLDNGSFTLAGTAGQQHFCMAPHQPSKSVSGYDNATYVPFTALSRVLEGEGLPQQLKIDIVNAQVPRQNVTDFRLGTELGAVEGRYSLLAPLQLESGSKIVYSKTEAGWNDDTVDKITISALDVTFTASTNVPLGVTITGYPVDVNGNRINNVTIEGATLSPYADNQAVTLHITGEIRHLDGVTFEAVTSSPENAGVLTPSQTIDLIGIHATVSGHYDDTL